MYSEKQGGGRLDFIVSCIYGHLTFVLCLPYKFLKDGITERSSKMSQGNQANWSERLDQLKSIVGVTSTGEIALLRKIPNAEDFIVTCLVAQLVAHKAGQATDDNLTIDQMISCGGLAYRPARQTVYNATSGLSKNHIIKKEGNKFRVDERTVLQFFATKLRSLLDEGQDGPRRRK
jgi:hypothetical protein